MENQELGQLDQARRLLHPPHGQIYGIVTSQACPELMLSVLSQHIVCRDN